MNHSGHIFMHQTCQFEIAGIGECDGVCVGTGEWSGGYARRVIETGTAWRNSRTSYREWWAYLRRSEKSYSMDFVSSKTPGDAVTGVDPDFIGKKGQRLSSLIVALCSYSGLPRFSVDHWLDHESGQDKNAAEKDC